MKELEWLLSSRHIIKSKDRDKYYSIKDSLEEIRKYATEKMGCQLIVNSLLIKLEKIPVHAENYMGISDFTDKNEYIFLCIVLMFLEDKEVEDQFVLSELTEYIVANAVEEKVDWTLFTKRRQLIKVLRFCINNGLLKINDGNDDSFMSDVEGEVLYENTGVSKYFMRNFSRDIMGYQEAKDFEGSDWQNVNEDRGMARRHRIYKRLLFSTGIYRTGENDEDFEYLKRYRNRIQEDFSKNFDAKLQVHKNSAYVIMGENSQISASFPWNNTISDIILLCNQLLLEEITNHHLAIEWDESVHMSVIAFERIIRLCKEKFGDGFLKSYRDKTEEEFVKLISEQMIYLSFVSKDEEKQEVIIRPIIGKVYGKYPDDFNTKEEEKKKK
ncbi:MAG: TIGR02678 family protein [Eubacteriales bacterium]